MSAQPEKINVLMVCLGRSPMAEAVLKHQITARPDSFKARFDVRVDSAGTGAYHEGDSADPRTVAVCRKHNVPINCIARAVERQDFQKFDYILAMDQNNLETLLHRKPAGSKAQVSMFGSFDPSVPKANQGSHKTRAKEIDDPYYGGRDGFDKSFERCTKFGDGFLDYLETRA
ncbi:hypothetical protein I350_01400 [Cryptococcus amylolentus CBS 6273]|nr:hypothetical protein I350_01400 [Cryptococcus amylolentus CBS 6273]